MKKFENYKSNLNILSKAHDEELCIFRCFVRCKKKLKLDIRGF